MLENEHKLPTTNYTLGNHVEKMWKKNSREQTLHQFPLETNGVQGFQTLHSWSLT